MTAALQSGGSATAEATEFSLLDDIVAQSKVAKTTTEHNRAKDLIGELVKEVMGGTVVFTLHVVLEGLRSDSDQARLLESVTARTFVLGCTPVVNLFQQNADPIRVTHAATEYPVVVDARRAFGYEVHSIDKVFRVKQTPHGESIDEFRPFFSLHHDDLLGQGDSVGEKPPGRYWHTHRDASVAESSPGYELSMSIVDADFEPAAPQTDTLSIQVTATNRDLPSLLSFGNVGGDLFMEGGSVAREIRLLRKPTPSQQFERGKGSLVAGHDINLQSQRHIAVAVKAGLSLFTHGKAGNANKPNTESGLQLHAASGSVSVQAQGSTVNLAAQNAVQLASTTDALTAGAAQHILLVGGKSGLKISNGNITLTTSGAAKFGAGKKVLTSGGAASSKLTLKKAKALYNESFKVTDEATGAAIPFFKYRIENDKGEVLARGITDAQGQTVPVTSARVQRIRIVAD